MCRLNKNISYLRFKKFKCRFCTHLHGYRFTHTKNQFKESAEKNNTKVRFLKMGELKTLIELNGLEKENIMNRLEEKLR